MRGTCRGTCHPPAHAARVCRTPWLGAERTVSRARVRINDTRAALPMPQRGPAQHSPPCCRVAWRSACSAVSAARAAGQTASCSWVSSRRSRARLLHGGRLLHDVMQAAVVRQQRGHVRHGVRQGGVWVGVRRVEQGGFRSMGGVWEGRPAVGGRSSGGTATAWRLSHASGRDARQCVAFLALAIVAPSRGGKTRATRSLRRHAEGLQVQALLVAQVSPRSMPGVGWTLGERTA